jgi:hypothetical protein
VSKRTYQPNNRRRADTALPRRIFVTVAGLSAHRVNLFVPGLTRGGYRRLMRERPRC